MIDRLLCQREQVSILEGLASDFTGCHITFLQG